MPRALPAAVLLLLTFGGCQPDPAWSARRPSRPPTPERLVAEAAIRPTTAGEEAVYLPVTLQGHPATVLLDLGTNGALALSRSAVRDIGLPEVGTLASLSLGTAVERRIAFRAVIEEFPIDAPEGMSPVVGLLGSRVLSHYDLVFDGPSHRVRLYAPSGPRWFSSAPSERWLPTGITAADCVHMEVEPGSRRAFISVRVNGHVLRGMFDSGSYGTNINVAAARLLGITGRTPGVHQLSADASPQFVMYDSQPVWEVPAATLTVGTRQLTVTPLFLYPHLPRETGPDDAELSLGLGAIRDRVLFVSYSTRQLCVGKGASTPSVAVGQ